MTWLEALALGLAMRTAIQEAEEEIKTAPVGTEIALPGVPVRIKKRRCTVTPRIRVDR